MMNGRISFILVLFCFLSVFASGQNVTGKVLDKETEEPIPGVNIILVGTENGTITDPDGNFELNVSTQPAQLRFSFIGYENQVVDVEPGQFLTIYLQSSDLLLGDVVVVGYGKMRKENLTGSVSSIDVEETLEARPITDVARGLQGVTPGLTITSSTGDLGQNPEISLRGINGSLNTEAQPLILVDNVEVPNLMMINPDDIKSISVLKDAASASIYGSRGAWGVILIETKTGDKSDKTNVTYSNNFSWNTPTKIPEIAGTVEGAEMAFAAYKRIKPNTNVIGGLGMYVDETAIQKMKEWRELYGGQDLGSEMVLGRDFEYRDGSWFYYRPWDVRELYLRDWSPQQNHNLTISGGSEKTTYNLSFGYLNQRGALKVKPDEYNRYNATINVQTQVTNWAKFRVKGMMSKSNTQTPFSYSGTKADPWYYLLRWPKYYPYGTYEGKPFRSSITDVSQANMIEDKETFQRVSIGTTLNLAKDLTLDADYTYSENNNHIYEPGGWAEGYNFWGNTGINNYMVYTSSSYNGVKYISAWDETSTFKAYTTYDHAFGDHALKLMAGTDVESFEYWRHNSERRELIDKDKAELGLATGDQYVDGARSHWSTLGFFGRINYSYKNRYLFELNGRYDGSSNFPSNDQWGFFPSFSVGYRITEEPFMDFVKPYVSSFKLRGSWGSIGNHDVGSNTYVATMASGNSNWLINGVNQLTIWSPRVVPESLTWETVTTLDIGFDARFLDNALGLTFDWYRRTTSDMVTSGETLPNTFGASAPQQNFGEVQTTGWEISVDWNHQFANGLNINATASLFDFKEELTKFAGNSKNIYGYYEGKKIGEIWGYETDRFFTEDDFVKDSNGDFVLDEGKYVLKDGIPSQSIFESGWFFYGPGDIKYKDLNGDGKIDYGSNSIDDHGDLKVIGNSLPRYQYSFRIGADWKGVDFSIFFQGVGKRDYWATGPVFIPGYRYGEGWYEHQEDYWTPENPDAFYPRPTSHDWTNNARNFLRQTKYLLDMSYLRCKNLTVGYTLPQSLVSRVGIDRLRLYFSGENLFEFDNMNIPIDPETGNRDGAYDFAFGRSYPFRRTVSFGLQLTL
ncbi:SusC/RagA family TonB-linked outer membrane protein [Thermophagus sp. OGC60D27]|uniref:SusC/RagA family TonB-linked outer membrane protein n=1 Tax=Thermophagus sp. OGC60D27 TaxID=3458415 RepID=UPI004037D7B0